MGRLWPRSFRVALPVARFHTVIVESSSAVAAARNFVSGLKAIAMIKLGTDNLWMALGAHISHTSMETAPDCRREQCEVSSEIEPDNGSGYCQ